MAVASGRMLQDTDTENITFTSSTSFAIDDVEPQPELIDENTGEVASPDEDEGTVTPWRVQPKPMPANYVITAQVDPSDEDTRYAYTFAVAGEDASITSHAGSEDPDEDDSVLYFKLGYPDTCDVSETAPTSFMTSKFQVPSQNSYPFRPYVPEKSCWKAPAGYYISEGVPVSHKLIFQLFHYSLDPEKNEEWTYDGPISTIQGKGKLLVTCQTNAYACMFIYIELNCQPQINLSSLFVSQTKLMFGCMRMRRKLLGVLYLNYPDLRVIPSLSALVLKTLKLT